jgi:hypothetical protein
LRLKGENRKQDCQEIARGTCHSVVSGGGRARLQMGFRQTPASRVD